ncbi:hypothetical protein WOLCODRAFT_159329 [Wolfiporia cocos MD-104 SS10]|uniref:Uncharacterized protein n=1 Tax=Wolfiporia cocos (strain MD-104) TaxID=742152 RepID=A0A2H3JVD2_WOLCO|nr:hypothetical protein WOLCODRAFT_159329 [Wolfiporia cocos MD-104 SS10]
MAPSMIPPTMVARVLNIHGRLRNSPLYLGQADVQQNVKWVRRGNSDILVLRHEIGDNDENDHAEAEATTQANDAPSTTEVNTSTDTEAEPVQGSDDPAILSAVCEINASDFYMTADGGYQGPTQYIPSFAQVKPTCTGSKPGVVPFTDDFAQVCDNIKALQREITTPGFTHMRGVLSSDEPRFARLKMQHVLFQPKDADDDENNAEDSPHGDIPSFCKIENWPTYSAAAATELQRIIDDGTLDLIPLPAYDRHGDLMFPGQYRNYLTGAVVECHFTLSHWSIKKNNIGMDVFVADVVALRVIIPPTSFTSPRKRRVPPRLDPLSPPSPDAPVKRLRF